MVKFIENLKKNKKFNENFEKYMFFIAILGSVFLYIQAYKIYEKKSANDISIVAFSIVLFVSLNWLLYGYILDKKVIILSSILGAIGSSIVLYLTYLYQTDF